MSHPVWAATLDWRAEIVVFSLSTLPASASVVPLMIAGTDLVSVSHASGAADPRLWLGLALMLLAVAPFLAGGVAFTSVMLSRRDLAVACRYSSAWFAAMGTLAFCAALLTAW